MLLKKHPYEKIMPTRRQQRLARLVKESVSDTIANHLNDPRIKGFVSVTRVEMGPDLRSVDVYLSIFSSEKQGNEKINQRTFSAILHARNRIQSFLAGKLASKFCPTLRFHKDEQFKNALQTMKVIEQVTQELKQKDSPEPLVE